MDYTTLDKVKARLSNYDSAFDALLADLITGVSAQADTYVNFHIGSLTYTDFFLSKKGKQRIILPAYPVTEIGALKYRSGENPDVYTAYGATEYDVDLASGIVFLRHGYFPSEQNGLQVTFTAGYLVDFEHETDLEKHNLPADICLAVTDWVIRKFNLRQAAGVSSTNVGGSTTNYKDALDKDITDVLDRYRIYEF